ncbi:MAG: uroporphyrinogen-III synthase, partial [Spirochaetales bacterium]|nr:uroporphyrinogen-III synthase [Spirochaetales bacterium]
LKTIPGLIEKEGYGEPGLLIAGEITSFGFDTVLGALEGKKILLTCSERMMDRACRITEDLGGTPLPSSLIRLERTLDSLTLEGYDWVVLTSPAAIEFFMELVKLDKIDLRKLPKIMVCGNPSKQKLLEYGIHADLCPPASYGAEELKKAASYAVVKGEKILRLRSAMAGPEITDALVELGCAVTDTVLYDNRPVPAEETCPESDAVFFASSSGVKAFIENWGSSALEGKILLAIGEPTARTIRELSTIEPLTAREADIPSALMTLAAALVERKLKETV